MSIVGGMGFRKGMMRNLYMGVAVLLLLGFSCLFFKLIVVLSVH